MKDSPDRGKGAAGWAVISCFVTGFLGLISTLMAFVSDNWMAGGFCLVASALAFGLLANATLRG